MLKAAGRAITANETSRRACRTITMLPDGAIRSRQRKFGNTTSMKAIHPPETKWGFGAFDLISVFFFSSELFAEYCLSPKCCGTISTFLLQFLWKFYLIAWTVIWWLTFFILFLCFFCPSCFCNIVLVMFLSTLSYNLSASFTSRKFFWRNERTRRERGGTAF